MLWLREEPLSSADGQECLQFLLDRGVLLCEWDLHALKHSLPTTARVLPAYLYLFRREADRAVRQEHHPSRVVIQGQLRSHVELPHLIEDAFRALRSQGQDVSAHGQWQVHFHAFVQAQREWSERWPDAADPNAIHNVESLKSAGIPLATLTTIRHTPSPDPAQGLSRGAKWKAPTGARGVRVRAENRQLSIDVLTPNGEYEGGGFLVLVQDDAWVSPLAMWLASGPVQQWLDHHAERRNDRWALTESLLRLIPIPKVLVDTLKRKTAPETAATEMAGNESFPWEQDLVRAPERFLEDLNGGLSEAFRQPHAAAALLIKANEALDHLRTTQARVLSIVSPGGELRWNEVLDLLPQSELESVLALPQWVKVTGSMPLQVPINRVTRVKTPALGIQLTTEQGYTLTLLSPRPRVLDMLYEQIERIQKRSIFTWGELSVYLRLPKYLEVAESTANELIAAQGEILGQLRALEKISKHALRNLH